MLTIFKLLQISGLNKLRFDRLKPPEKFSDEHHYIMLQTQKNQAGPLKKGDLFLYLLDVSS